tara:strand:+ start:6779 stop:7288 length:510 start_codon:yes stop_codon:yes gene_type:complete
MKAIIEALKSENVSLNNYQRTALDILSNKMEFATTEVAKDGNCMVGGYDTHKELTAEAMRDLCRINYVKCVKKYGKANMHTPGWGEWLGIRIKFNLSEKQYRLICRNLSHPMDHNFHEELLNDSLELFPGVWVQFKTDGVWDGPYGKYYKIIGHVFYADTRPHGLPTIS